MSTARNPTCGGTSNNRSAQARPLVPVDTPKPFGGTERSSGVMVADEVPVVESIDAESWCRSMYPRLVGAMSLYCGSLEDAEDVAQETLSRAWERWASLNEHPAPESWAFRTAFNLANSRWRRLRNERRAHARL